MITKNSIHAFRGAIIDGGDDCLYIPPNALLRRYISHYCISFPTREIMSDQYTVLPSASSVICVFVHNGKISINYDGTGTKAMIVGASANQNDMLLLIKFRAGGFFPFYGFSQNELTDFSLELDCIDKNFSIDIERAIVNAKQIEDLVAALDLIFMNLLKKDNHNCIASAVYTIVAKRGNLSISELNAETYYSERHLRRLFLQYIGASPKKFSRIVRVNYALRLLQENPSCFADIPEKMGYFDQAHFVHDFKDIFNLTPNEYTKNMSVFYNADSI